jgi:hypothetical protein
MLTSGPDDGDGVPVCSVRGASWKERVTLGGNRCRVNYRNSVTVSTSYGVFNFRKLQL